MANSVGQTVAEGLTSFADSVSSWLSGPLDGELEPETPSRRAASARCNSGHKQSCRSAQMHHECTVCSFQFIRMLVPLGFSCHDEQHWLRHSSLQECGGPPGLWQCGD